ncbi:Rho guanine nucleotide exchange factor (GEF) 17 [Dissophora ornata]|nr:Rho guanine nucleotide exchange factor (GEF) 17 [Dissophora ornata]
MDLSPNSVQPRSRAKKDLFDPSISILGPNPPQIQLSFLEDQQLPSTPSTPSAPPALIETTASDFVLVERKDSGYGGSVSRSSSLAALGRGIRKVFGRNSPKGSIESFAVTDLPVLDCDIPQDVLDHEGWAQDLAQRLTYASAPDAVTAWLGQLPTEGTMLPALTSAQGDSEPAAARMNELKDSQSPNSAYDMAKEMGFMTSQSNGLSVSSGLPRSKSESTIIILQGSAATVSIQDSAQSSTGKALRKVLSGEHLNKPQPPLPLNAPLESKHFPSVPKTVTGSSSSFNDFARKLTVATEVKFGKSSLNSASFTRHRPDIQQIFRESASETALLYPAKKFEGRLSGDSIEELLDGPSLSEMIRMASTKEREEPHSPTVTPSSQRSNRLFKSLATSPATGFINQRQNEVRPLSEVLLSSSNLRPDEIRAKIVTASRSSSLRSPPSRRGSQLSVFQDGYQHTSSYPLVPPKPLFYSKGIAASVSSLGGVSSCGSVDSSVAESSADESDGLSRMAQHAREQDARYNADLKDLQTLLYQAELPNGARFTPPHSANTSTGSLPSVTSSPSRKDKSAKTSSKKDDYMSHRMSGCSPKLTPAAGKSKPRSKTRLSMTYGGGELEIVKHAKFDTPEAIVRNKEIRKFISQEIYTTELNYLQYLRVIQEVFVEPLLRSFDTDKPFIPRSSPLCQLLAHVSALMDVSSEVVQRLEDCVRDEVWSHESSQIGTIFLDVKEPLSIFLKYGQSYGKGMKALRALMKSKRVSVMPALSPANTLSSATSGSVTSGAPPRMDKRRSLPSIFSLNGVPSTPSSTLQESSWTGSSSGSGYVDTNIQKPSSSHGMLETIGEVPEFEQFLRNCAGGKETTCRFSLADLLILPIQRVTRYGLLLKDLKKHTDVEHQDYVCIVHALEQVHTLALATNNVQPSSLRL